MKKKQAKFLFEALFETITDPILIHPLLEEGFAPFELVNKAAVELYEYSEEELYQIAIPDITKAIFADEYKKKQHRSELKEAKTKRFETVHVTKSGKNILVDVNLTVIVSEGKEMVLVVVRNITEKKGYEEKLIEIVNKANDTSQMLEVIINTIPVRLFWKDLNSNYLGCNKLFAKDGGKETTEELIGKNDYDMNWAEQADLYRSDDKLVMKSGVPKMDYEEPQTNLDGSISWLRTSKIPLIDNKGVVKGILGVYEDITLKKVQELKLKNTQKELLHAQEIANLGSWSFNLDTHEFKFSEELCRICGYSIENKTISFDAWCNLVYYDDRDSVISFIKNAIETKVDFNISHRVVRFNDGVLVWLNVIGEYVEDVTGDKFIQGTAQDFTKLKSTQLELENHKKNLESLIREKTNELEISNKELIKINNKVISKNQLINDKNIELQNTLDVLKETKTKLIYADKMASLGILTAGISHELNNPLNFIQGGVLGLKSVLGEVEVNSEVEELLEAIDTGVLRATEIISGLNQFNRTNDDYEEECDIHSIIDNALIMLRNKFKFRVDIHKNYSEEDVKVKGNVGKLHQVFVNLISNANQAIEDKGAITITTELKKDSVVVSIQDTGCGIDQDSLQHIFDPFYTTKEPGKGIGLGLSITYNIIQEHKGNIEFKSEKNKGTIAVVTFAN